MLHAVSIDSVAKRYRLGNSLAGDYNTLRESINRTARRFGSAMAKPFMQREEKLGNDKPQRSDTLWALRDVSFDIEPGEVIGIIGRNGSGKSTLLKILSRITVPTRGRIRLQGRVSSLLEVGTGFHHELTGRENIYLNGAILGMTRREIQRKFDAIVDFSETERFLDTPVKRYSSGMFVRLAFAIAAHMEPEILIVDEVLAVGDAAFQRKCLGKMSEINRSGRTVIFVSHNMATVLNLCEKVAWLDRGVLQFFGDTKEGAKKYVRDNNTTSGSSVDLETHENRRHGCETILGSLRLLSDDGQPCDQFPCGESMIVELEVAANCPDNAYQFAIGFDDEVGRRLFTVATYLASSTTEPDRNRRRVRCRLSSIPLAPGRYAISLNAGPPESVWRDFVDRAIWIDVQPSNFYGNGRIPKAEWGDFVVRSDWTNATT